MLPINTVYLDNVGFKEAYFLDINLDFHNPNSSNKKSLDTLISLENTGGKSSMISFILTMFVPKKSRFVQHIQESNHKFEDYFYPTPGLILLKLELPEDKGRLLIDENNYLILGQYVTVSQNKTSRYFFSFESTPSLKFEDVPSLSKEGKDFNEDNITKWLNEGHQKNSTFFHTDTHHKWVDKLNTMGIDTWLAEKQVEFCSAEGGIKEFVNFSSEADFLKEFFYMAISEDATENIKISLKDTLQKLSKMPQNKEKVEHLNKLLDNLQNFKKESDKYIISANYYENSQVNIHMHYNAIDEKKIELSEEAIVLEEATECIKQSVIECQEKIQNSEKYIESLTLQKYTYEIEEKSDDLEKKEDELREGKVELGSYKVARPKLKVNSLSKIIEGLEESISKASEGLEPLREILYQYAWEYTCKIKYLTNLEKKEQKELEQNSSILDLNIKKLTSELKELKENNKKLIENKSTKKTLIESRQNALDKLIEKMYVETNETVENRLKINRKELESVKGVIDTIGQDKKQKNKNKNLLSEKITDIRLEQQKQVTNCRDVEKNIEKEEQSRFKILENALIKQLNDYEEVEVISTTLLLKVKKQLEINISDLKTNEILHSKIEEEIQLLQKTGSKLIDGQVQKLLELLHAKGISNAKLFPHYLADIYKDDSQKIKNKIESNPGIFLGIAVNTLDELNKAQLLSGEINFLSKPIVVSLTSCIDSLSDAESIIISVPSNKIYSQKELPAYIDKLQEQADKLFITIEENGNKVDGIENLKRDLTEYFSSYGNGRIEQIKHNFTQLNTQLEELKISLNIEEAIEIKLQETMELLEEKEEKQGEKKSKINISISQLKTFYNEHDKNHETIKQEYQIYSNELDENIELLDSTEIELSTEGQKKIDIEKKLDTSTNTLEILSQELEAITATSDNVGKTIDEEELALNDKSSYKQNYEDAQNILRREENKEGLSDLNSRLEMLSSNLEEARTELYQVEKANDYNIGKVEVFVKVEDEKILQKIKEFEKKISTLKIKISHLDMDKKVLIKSQKEYIRNLKYPENSIVPITESLKDVETQLINKNIEFEKSKKNKEVFTEKQKQNELKNTVLFREVEKIDAYIKRLNDHIDNTILKNTFEVTLPDGIDLYEPIIDKLISDVKNNKQIFDTLKEQIQIIFDKVTKQVQKEDFKKLMPNVSYNIAQNSALIATKKAVELVKKVSENIEILNDALSKDKEDYNILLNMLLGHVELGISKLKSAVKNSILPESLPAIGNKAALKMGSKLNNKNQKERESGLRIYIDELLEVKTDTNHFRIPSVNSQSKDEVTTELVYAVLGSKKDKVGIQLINISNPQDYYSIDKVPGSGGQRLTSALLLYLIMAQMRAQSKTGNRQIQSGGFLLLDNPFGAASKPELVASQVKMGEKLGFQLIYASGIQDHNAQSFFKHRISLSHMKNDIANNRKLIAIEETINYE